MISFGMFLFPESLTGLHDIDNQTCESLQDYKRDTISRIVEQTMTNLAIRYESVPNFQVFGVLFIIHYSILTWTQ